MEDGKDSFFIWINWIALFSIATAQVYSVLFVTVPIAERAELEEKIAGIKLDTIVLQRQVDELSMVDEDSKKQVEILDASMVDLQRKSSDIEREIREKNAERFSLDKEYKQLLFQERLIEVELKKVTDIERKIYTEKSSSYDLLRRLAIHRSVDRLSTYVIDSDAAREVMILMESDDIFSRLFLNEVDRIRQTDEFVLLSIEDQIKLRKFFAYMLNHLRSVEPTVAKVRHNREAGKAEILRRASAAGLSVFDNGREISFVELDKSKVDMQNRNILMNIYSDVYEEYGFPIVDYKIAQDVLNKASSEAVSLYFPEFLSGKEL